MDDVKLVEAWRLAGADMNSKDYKGNTASSIVRKQSYYASIYLQCLV